MHIETERKFLVRSDAYKAEAVAARHIQQGYIAHDGGNTVRVRILDGQGILTIKGRSLDGGLSRPEWEMEIPTREALDLLPLCHGGYIDKTRHIVPVAAACSAPKATPHSGTPHPSDAPAPPTVSFVPASQELVSSGPLPLPLSGGGQVRCVEQPSSAPHAAGTLVFEVDEFHGDNEGLVMAEIELPSADTPFPRPDWLGEEVTGDKRYYNSYLTQHPYKTW